MRLSKKIKFFEESAKAHNLMIDNVVGQLKARAKECYNMFLEEEITCKFRECRASETFTNYRNKVLKEYKELKVKDYSERLIQKWSIAQQRSREFGEWIDNYVERCRKNKETLKSMCDNQEIPLFITLNSLIESDRIHYCFAYEFFNTKEEGIYDAYVYDSKRKEPYRATVDYRVYEVRPMTKFEFEHIYLMNRLEYKCHDFTDEEHLVEFDNHLRQLFNGQDRT